VKGRPLYSFSTARYNPPMDSRYARSSTKALSTLGVAFSIVDRPSVCCATRSKSSRRVLDVGCGAAGSSIAWPSFGEVEGVEA